MITIVLFFDPYPYRSSDLMECILSLRRGDFQHLFIAVRPILPFIGLITPISSALTITIINIISYIASYLICFHYVHMLFQNTKVAFYSAYFTTFVFPLILTSSARMSDVLSYFVSLCILVLFVKKVYLNYPNADGGWIYFGLFSGLVTLIRENVWASILAICTYLLSINKVRILLIYLSTAIIIPGLWNIFTTINYKLNYLAAISTAISLSMKYSGVVYNPLKVLGYLLDGLTPFLLIFILLWIINEVDEKRFKFLNIISIPFLSGAILWPGLYEPRIAIVVLPAVAPLIGYGANELISRASYQPIYRKLGKKGLEIVILTSYLLFNVLLAYLNNGSKFSYIFSEIIH